MLHPAFTRPYLAADAGSVALSKADRGPSLGHLHRTWLANVPRTSHPQLPMLVAA